MIEILAVMFWTVSWFALGALAMEARQLRRLAARRLRILRETDEAEHVCGDRYLDPPRLAMRGRR